MINMQASKDGCPKVGGIEICGVQAISAMRVISYEAATKRLRFDLAAEYSKLRNGTLVAPTTAVQISAGQTSKLPLPTGEQRRRRRRRSAACWLIEIHLPACVCLHLSVDLCVDLSESRSVVWWWCFAALFIADEQARVLPST